jgi:hypothetical protein
MDQWCNGQQNNFIMVRIASFYIFKWTMDPWCNGRQNNFIMVRIASFYMAQMDDGSMETMDPWQQRFTEANKE